MLVRWTVRYGPEFDECKRKWRRQARFDMHLGAIRFMLERDPYRYSTAYMGENDRVVLSNDFVKDGFVMTAFVKLDPAQFEAEIMWVELRMPATDEESQEEDA